MATSFNQISPMNKSPPLDMTTSPRHRPVEQGSAPNGSNRPTKGRVRNGGRNKVASGGNRPTPTPSCKPDKPPPPVKPTLSVTSPPSHSGTNSKPKNPSRRPSRTNSSAYASQSSPVVETLVTPSSRPLNRRRRSGASGGNLPKIMPPAPNDDLLRPGRPRISVSPHIAPFKDTPPHLSQKSSHTSFDMGKDIDALVERVRAVAMAENRPSTPGSHIDWAGDDDDSLPDLDDWGIPSISEHKVQAISPIMVGGLKPLPEPSLLSGHVIDGSRGQTVSKRADPQDASPHPTSDNSPPILVLPGDKSSQRTLLHPSLPPKPQATPTVRAVNESHEPLCRAELSGESKVLSVSVVSQSTPDAASSIGSEQLKTQDGGFQKAEAQAETEEEEVGPGGLAASIHAPSIEKRAELKPEDGLMASIYAPRALPASNSSFAQFDGQLPRNREGHIRSQTVGRPFPRPSDDVFTRSPRIDRGVPHKSSRHHARNHSSPSATMGSHRTPHSRPVLTGDAISRLVRTIGSTTAPPTKLTPLAND